MRKEDSRLSAPSPSQGGRGFRGASGFGCLQIAGSGCSPHLLLLLLVGSLLRVAHAPPPVRSWVQGLPLSSEKGIKSNP